MRSIYNYIIDALYAILTYSQSACSILCYIVCTCIEVMSMVIIGLISSQIIDFHYDADMYSGSCVDRLYFDTKTKRCSG